MNKQNRPIQSLWIGEKLSLIEVLCIKSFLYNGHDFHLYVYENVQNVPVGTKILDANQIIPYNSNLEVKEGFGKNSKAPFADFFRLNLLYKRGGWWVDMDVVCLSNFNDLPDEVIASSLEIPEGDCANINVISFPPKHQIIKSCLQQWKTIDNNNLYYAKGVDIVKEQVNRHRANKIVQPHHVFNPVSYRCAEYIFRLPVFLRTPYNILRTIRKQEKIEFPVRSSYAIHLWNEILKGKELNKESIFPYYSLIEILKRKYQ